MRALRGAAFPKNLPEPSAGANNAQRSTAADTFPGSRSIDGRELLSAERVTRELHHQDLDGAELHQGG